MTDKEIIEGLRCCGKIDRCLQCRECPYFREVDCVDKSTNDVLDLINRQQAEIERLTKCRKEEVEKLMSAIDKVITEAKIEAIQEFANEILSPFEGQAYLSKKDLETIVKNLAKYYQPCCRNGG